MSVAWPLRPTAAPSGTERPTSSAAPSLLPSLSTLPTFAPSPGPTSQGFTCPDVWPQVVSPEAVALPLHHTEVTTRKFKLIPQEHLTALFEHPHWTIGEEWTMQVQVTSTCPRNLRYGFFGNWGLLWGL